MIPTYKKGDENRLDLINKAIINKVFDVFLPLEKFHQYQFSGLNHIPLDQGFILISNHSFIAYDMLFFMKAYYRKTGKFLRGVTDHSVFKVPFLRSLFLQMGILDGTMENSSKILQNKYGLIIYPGGAREAMKPSNERYQLRWQGRYGFIKLAIKNKVPIIPLVSKGHDETFKVFLDGYTLKWSGLPLPLFKGIQKTQITHIIKKPLELKDQFASELEEKLYIRKIQRKLISIFDQELHTSK